MKRFFKKIFFKKNSSRSEIYPDEVFLDSSNLPQFDTYQFEGAIEKPISKKSFLFIGSIFFLVFLTFSIKLWNLQIKEGEAYALKSENNHLRHSLIFSDRGMIFDRNGTKLAWNYNNNEKENDFSLRVYDSLGLSHILGFIKYPAKDKQGFYYQTSFVGTDGLEKAYDYILSGVNGLKIIETDVFGNVESESVIKPPKPGNSLNLSIDERIQKKLFEIIERSSDQYGFLGGSGIIMDVHTGEIISMASYPEYDSNVLTEGKDREEIEGYINNQGKPFLNRAVSGLYTPGSIMKPFVAIGVLNEGVISPEKKILSTGSISVPNPYFPDMSTVFMDWKAHGYVDMKGAIAQSSNVYFFAVGGGFEDQKGIGISNIEKYVRMFGFGENTGIELEGEKAGVIPNPVWKSQTFSDGLWRLGDTYNTSIGQYGFLVTPIQAVRAVAAIANDGFLVHPTFLLEDSKKTRTKIDIPKEYFQIVKDGMRQAVLEGTAKNLNTSFVQMAAKTGTAEIDASKKYVNSWIIGFFPYDNPKYAFVVMMERGSRANSVGALFVFRQLLDWMNIHTSEYFKN